MAYAYRDRLTHNKRRMAEVNDLVVTYTLASGTVLSNVHISPIFKRGALVQLMSSSIRKDRQHWAINKTYLVVSNVEVLPSVGDIITLSDGSEYRVVEESDSQPHYDYVTTARDRYLIFSVLEKGPT